VTLTGKGVKRVQKRPRGAGAVRVLVRAKGKFLKRLNRTGKAKVRVTVTFRPNGGSADKRGLTLVLRKRLR
jgi:hypothetical protein